MEYADEIAKLGDGGTVIVGDITEDGFFVLGGLEISLDGVLTGVGGYDEQAGDYSAPLSDDDDVRKAVALLTAYLALKGEKS